MLDYDAFPCPTHAQEFTHPMMFPVCYILRTSAFNETGTGFLNLTHSLQGSFFASLPNFCHTIRLNQPEYTLDVSMECELEVQDEEHLSLSHWKMFDARTGLLIYSSSSYLLSGEGKSGFFFPEDDTTYSMMIPLFQLSETIEFKDQTLWEEIRELHSTRQKIVWSFSILSITLIILIVVSLVILIRAKRANKLYSRLREMKLD